MFKQHGENDMGLKVITSADISSWEIFNNPGYYFPEEWQGTIEDGFQHPTLPTFSKIEMVCRLSVMTEQGLKAFALDCAKRAESRPHNPRFPISAIADKAALDCPVTAASGASGAAWNEYLGYSDRDKRQQEWGDQLAYLQQAMVAHPDHFVQET